MLLAVVLVIGLLLLKDNLARSFAEQQIRRNTGFDTKLGKVQIGLLEPRVTFENLTLYNPPEFGGSAFFDAPDIHVEYVPSQLALGRVHLKFVRLNLRELNIVETNGKTNLLELLRDIIPPSDTNSSTRSSRYTFTGIDLLNLSIGRIRYIDPRRPKRNQDIQLGLENHLVHNVRSEVDFANILLKLLFRAGITIYVDDHLQSPRKKN